VSARRLTVVGGRRHRQHDRQRDIERLVFEPLLLTQMLDELGRGHNRFVLQDHTTCIFLGDTTGSWAFDGAEKSDAGL
jgi:hypothetical protein